jgi:hypothetical protein
MGKTLGAIITGGAIIGVGIATGGIGFAAGGPLGFTVSTSGLGGLALGVGSASILQGVSGLLGPSSDRPATASTALKMPRSYRDGIGGEPACWCTA